MMAPFFSSEERVFASAAKTRILIGICSAGKYVDRRRAVRETWLNGRCGGIKAFFFVGRGELSTLEADTLSLDVKDTYHALPSKILAFMEYCLKHYDFDWLYKCDDDTYVDMKRLLSLADIKADLIGDESLADRGAPSGGAGYLLRREYVEQLVKKRNEISKTGCEDLIIGKKVIELGAIPHSTERLVLHAGRFPRPDNDIISCHWCSPALLRIIHQIRNQNPRVAFDARHEHWTDRILFYPGNVYVAEKQGSTGVWRIDDDGNLHLKWHSWPEEILEWDGNGYTRESPLFTVNCHGEKLSNLFV